MVRRTVACFFVLLLLSAAAMPKVWADPSTSADKQVANEEETYELQKLLVDTLDQVQRNYVKDVSRRELVEAAIRGIVEELDPYSSYISQEDIGQFRTSVESEFGGVGIQIEVDNDQLKVLSPLVGTPAYRAGLIAGDRIVEIDGKSTDGISLEEAVSRLKGNAGTKVTLTIIHPGRSTKDQVVITREVIRIHTVLGDHYRANDAWDFMLDADKRIGYIRVSAFSRNTASELRAALDELKKANLAGLILDLRFNPGGLLASAIEVSDLFVSSGRIVSVEGRNSPERTWDAREKGTYEGFPMVVLVNRFSASASEIVAACLQDHHRAVVIGERTWGKGSVQNVISMEGNKSALKLTTASYHRPSGKNIHRFPDSKDDDEWGVQPDDGYRLRLTDREVISLMENRRRRDIIRHGLPADEAKPTPEATARSDGDASVPSAGPDDHPDKADFVDPHLRMAMDYLSGELARAETASAKVNKN